MQTQTDNSQQTLHQTHEYVGALGAKGGVTLPAEVHRFLQVKPHDKVVFRIHNEKVELTPATVMSLEEVARSVPPLTTGQTIEDAIREAKEERAEQFLAKQRK